jgi:poly-gamma-glutamate synthesis protein (capsule biosynthesis protein)
MSTVMTNLFKLEHLLTYVMLFLLAITALLLPSCTGQVMGANVVVAVGDVMLSRDVGVIIRTVNDPRAPFLETVEILEEADIAFCNLESPFHDGEPQNEDRMIFGADPETVEGLRYAGFDIVSLANNHFGDQGVAGMNFTLYHLNEHGIEYTGAGEDKVKAREPVIIERNGVKFAFLGYNDVKSAVRMGYAATSDKPGFAVLTEDNLIQDITNAKHRAHVVVISIHWGIEYEETPTQRQITLAHLAIDSGASLVLGHHPHVIQPVEEYKSGYIFYSLGNFVFDQVWSEETRIGLIAKIFFQGRKIQKVEMIEVTIYESHQPVVRKDGDGL